jgi:hypothetical protein
MITSLLTVRQPFATYIIHGEKTIENRGRRVNYRGRVGIHSGVAPHALANPELRWKIARGESPEFPTAAVLGTVQIVGCHRAYPGCCAAPSGALQPGEYPGSDDVWHWELGNAREFITPIRHVRGALGFWPADDRLRHLMSIAEVIER